MSRAHRHNPKKVFWTIAGLSVVFALLLMLTINYLASPQASGTTISAEFRGVIVYDPGSKPTEQALTLAKIDAATNTAVATFSVSKQNSELINRKPNRIYRYSGLLEYGAQYKIILGEKCSLVFDVPAKDSLKQKVEKLDYVDKKFVPDSFKRSAAYFELGRINGDCKEGDPSATVTPLSGLRSAPTTPTPSGTASPTATPTPDDGSESPTPTPSTAPTATPTPDDGSESPTPVPSTVPSATPTPGGADQAAVPFKLTECNEKYDVFIVADASGTMDDTTNRGPVMKKFVERAIVTGKLHTGDRLGLVTFSSPSTVRIELSEDFNATKDRVNAMEFGADKSNINGGVQLASETFGTSRRSSDVPAIMIVISDSLSTMAPQAIALARADASTKLMRYFGVTVGGRNENLASLATAGKGSHISVRSASQVNTAVDTLFSRIDSLVQSCASINLAVEPDSIKTDQVAEAVFTVANKTRSTLTNAVITQSLPLGLIAEDGRSSLTATIARLGSGETATERLKVKGAN